MNTFGHNIRLTTFGESHGCAVGGVLDGFPSGVHIDFDAIDDALAFRRGQGMPGVSARATAERDEVEWLSGLLDGVTLGTPIAFIVRNSAQQSADYEALRDVFRPGHADEAYYRKYGIRDWRGGGRASARATLPCVVAGAMEFSLLLIRKH